MPCFAAASVLCRRKTYAADSVMGRAIANLQTVTVAEETAGPNEDKAIAKGDELTNVGLVDWALEELVGG